MPPIVVVTEIDRPPREVFAYATDPSRFPEWQRDVVRVEMEGDPLAVGSRFMTIRRFAGAEQRLVQEVSEVSPPHRWTAKAISGPIMPDGTLAVDPLDGRHSIARHVLDRLPGAGDRPGHPAARHPPDAKWRAGELPAPEGTSRD